MSTLGLVCNLQNLEKAILQSLENRCTMASHDPAHYMPGSGFMGVIAVPEIFIAVKAHFMLQGFTLDV